MGPRPQCYIPSHKVIGPFASGEEDFWWVFTIYGRGGQLGHVTQTLQTNFRSPIPLRLHMKFGSDRPSGFGEEDLWKWWTTDRRTDGRWRRTDDGPWLYYKLTNEPKGSDELKMFVRENSSSWLFKIIIGMQHDKLRSMVCISYHCRNVMMS